jgi:hypothetical protein
MELGVGKIYLVKGDIELSADLATRSFSLGEKLQELLMTIALEAFRDVHIPYKTSFLWDYQTRNLGSACLRLDLTAKRRAKARRLHRLSR